MRTIARVCAVAVFAVAAIVVQAQTTCPVAQLTSPTPGSTLPGSTVTFTWCNASADYFLTVESVLGAHDIFNAVVRVNSVTLINLPTNGGPVYVTLWTQINGQWQSPFHYTFTAAGGTAPPPPPAPAADYKLSAASTKVNVSVAQSGTLQFVMTPMNGFNGTVAFNCAGLPANVSCQFTPAQLLANGVPAGVSLVVSESAAAANHIPALPRGKSGLLWTFGSLGAGAFGMVFAGTARARRARLWLLLGCGLLLLVVLAGCGGYSAPPPATNSPSPQTVSATVMATATGGTQPAATPSQQFQIQITRLP